MIYPDWWGSAQPTIEPLTSWCETIQVELYMDSQLLAHETFHAAAEFSKKSAKCGVRARSICEKRTPEKPITTSGADSEAVSATAGKLVAGDAGKAEVAASEVELAPGKAELSAGRSAIATPHPENSERKRLLSNTQKKETLTMRRLLNIVLFFNFSERE